MGPTFQQRDQNYVWLIKKEEEMFSRYRCRPECLTRVERPVPTTCCPGPTIKPKNPALPESARIQREVNACTPYIRPSPSSNPCLSGQEPSTSQPTANHQPVCVRTVASSETTRLRAIQQRSEEQFSFDPKRRFAQYFPTFPLRPESILCPERIPNKVSVGVDLDSRCVPGTMFRPSVTPDELPPSGT